MVCKELPCIYHSSALLCTYLLNMLCSLIGFWLVFFVGLLSPSFSLSLHFLVVLTLFDNIPSRKGYIFPLPGNSHEKLLFWTFPRTLCVIECLRRGLPIDMKLINFLLPNVSCSLHQLEFYCLLCKCVFLDILCVSIVFFSVSGSI